ncbi:MAG TPA: TIGR03545 family protein [Pirellulaceae bacterium]|nr:TIGR03545 family protein [Pirellulaceae bacterium]
MYQMIQWKYVLPRLLVALVVTLVVTYGLEPVLNGFFVGIGERIIGAKIEIDDIDASLVGCDLAIHGVTIANPRSPRHNLLECDSASFDIETASVLKRRLVVREARLSGVRFNTPRSTSRSGDPLTLPDLQLPDEFETRFAKLGESALRQFTRVISQDLKNDLVSIQLSQELAERWPLEFQKLVARSTAIRQQIDQLRQSVDPTVNNVAGMAESFPNKVAEVERLKQQIDDIRNEVDQLLVQMGRDRVAIDIARKHDQEVIRRKLALKDLDPQNLSEYLLGEELNQQTNEIVRWIKIARCYWPSDVELPESERSHGEDIVFPGLKPMPKALVQKMFLDGTFLRGDHSLTWRGEISNLTTDPVVLGQPMVIRVATSGSHPFVLEATLDRSGDKPRDRVVISFPELPQPARMLGDKEQLAIAVAPGSTQVWAELELHGEQLTGRVLLQQKTLQLTAQMPPRYGPRVAESVANALGHVQHLQAEVRLAGTLDKPSLQLRSNLGPQVSAGLSQALRQELALRQAELGATLDQYLARQQSEFDELVATERQRALDQLQLSSSEIENVKQLVAGRIRIPGLGAIEDLQLKNPFTRR